MPGAADTMGGTEAGAEAGAGALAFFWGHITIPIMGTLTSHIMGILATHIISPTITPIILTVIDGRPGCVSISDSVVQQRGVAFTMAGPRRSLPFSCCCTV